MATIEVSKNMPEDTRKQRVRLAVHEMAAKLEYLKFDLANAVECAKAKAIVDGESETTADQDSHAEDLQGSLTEPEGSSGLVEVEVDGGGIDEQYTLIADEAVFEAVFEDRFDGTVGDDPHKTPKLTRQERIAQQAQLRKEEEARRSSQTSRFEMIAELSNVLGVRRSEREQRKIE
eukprot:jgi/Hompol1/4974/HPOL_002311-RA